MFMVRTTTVYAIHKAVEPTFRHSRDKLCDYKCCRGVINESLYKDSKYRPVTKFRPNPGWFMVPIPCSVVPSSRIKILWGRKQKQLNCFRSSGVCKSPVLHRSDIRYCCHVPRENLVAPHRQWTCHFMTPLSTGFRARPSKWHGKVGVMRILDDHGHMKDCNRRCLSYDTITFVIYSSMRISCVTIIASRSV